MSDLISFFIFADILWCLGSVGGTYATPVLVVLQVAIGALGRLQVVPRYVNKNGIAATFEEAEE